MKQKHFYSHIVETSSLSLALGDMDLTIEQRRELISLVEANIHHSIIDTVLSYLSEEDKRTFLLHLSNNHHERIWNLLKEKVENIEEKIEEVAKSLNQQFHDDIEEARKKK